MNPDSRAPSSRPFGSRLGRPPMTRSRRNTFSASHSPLDPFRSHNLNVLSQQDEGNNGNRTPHIEGLPDCRCIACHLKTQVFPRRQDGRIVLPAPWLLTPQQVSSSGLSPPKISTPQPRGFSEGQTHVPNVREPRTSVLDTTSGCDEQGYTRRSGHVASDINTDRGEGSSLIVQQLSGPGVAPLEPLVKTSLIPDEIHQGVQPSSSSSRVIRPDRRLHRSDRAKSLRIFRPYEKPTELNSNPSPPEHWLGPGHPDSPIMLLPPYPSRQEFLARRDDFRSDPYENIQSEQFPQLLEPAGQFGYNSGDISGTSSSNPNIPPQSQIANRHHSGIGASSFVPQSRPPWDDHQIGDRDQTISSEHRLVHSLHSGHPAPQRTHNLQISEEPQVYRFSSHSHNPQPSASEPVTLTDPTHFNSASRPHSPTLSFSQAGPAGTSFSWQAGGDELGPVRFQEPVVPEDLSGSPDRQREQLAIKWDSERKRRQGYFAQSAEGEEKSNFRHYNKSKIDFDN
ncbi:hypothetical protein CPB83DRAFT_855734 [Crepidotus variabilis]|uniref:Uncharacterized protein n=1 Tax=Crepidotus variabilis TaxID=179855 RepID=A0A9P6EEW8_9AGAR|nr:hypothetical protein CPB83DRAFT_855734 [Crepidotus variabilis]